MSIIDERMIVLFFLGLLILSTLYLYLLIRSTKRWIQVDGTIIDAYVYRSHSGYELDGRVTALYKAEIEYSYLYNNIEYRSKRIFYGDFWSSNWSKSAKKILSKYKRGDNVIVYCNPLEPEESVLIRDNYRAIRIQCLIALVLVVAYFIL